jgi:hypothetical protein
MRQCSKNDVTLIPQNVDVLWWEEPQNANVIWRENYACPQNADVTSGARWGAISTPASNLRTGIVWPRVILCHFHILASKISWFCLVFRCHSTCDIIPKLSINMETYLHLVSSQIPHIYYFITYFYSKTIIVLCNILNSQNMARQYICQWTMSQETNVLRRYWIKLCSMLC